MQSEWIHYHQSLLSHGLIRMHMTRPIVCGQVSQQSLDRRAESQFDMSSEGDIVQSWGKQVLQVVIVALAYLLLPVQ